MTDQRTDNEAVINEALGVIDGALAKMMQRELVSTGEVADLLLDVRTLLTEVDSAGPAGGSAVVAAAVPMIETIEPVSTESV